MIRTARADDKPRLIEMAARFLISSRYGEWLPSTPAQIAGLIEQIEQLGVILTAEEDSTIIGMLALVAVTHPMTGQRYAEEIAWWVEPEYRGGLIGPRLHRAGEQWARDLGLHMIRMLSPVGSDLGVYYARRGYVEVETSWMKTL